MPASFRNSVLIPLCRATRPRLGLWALIILLGYGLSNCGTDTNQDKTEGSQPKEIKPEINQGLKALATKLTFSDPDDSLRIGIVAQQDVDSVVDRYYTVTFPFEADTLVEPPSELLFINQYSFQLNTVTSSQLKLIDSIYQDPKTKDWVRLRLKDQHLIIQRDATTQFKLKPTYRVTHFPPKPIPPYTTQGGYYTERLVWWAPNLIVKHIRSEQTGFPGLPPSQDRFVCTDYDLKPLSWLNGYATPARVNKAKLEIDRLAAANCFDDFWDRTDQYRLPRADTLAHIADGSIQFKTVAARIGSLKPSTYTTNLRRYRGQLWAFYNASYACAKEISCDQEVHVSVPLAPIAGQHVGYNQNNIDWDWLDKTFSSMVDAYMSPGNTYLAINIATAKGKFIDIYHVPTGKRLVRRPLYDGEHVVAAMWSSAPLQ